MRTAPVDPPARFSGSDGKRPVEDIDVLVLGDPDADRLYDAVDGVERHLGRPVQVTIRAAEVRIYDESEARRSVGTSEFWVSSSSLRCN